MSIFDDIRAMGPAYRLTEEKLYAEALREIESGQRRDGIWAKAMADSDMDQGKAGAKYIKLRVQSLKDEALVLIADMNRNSEALKQISTPIEAPPIQETSERSRESKDSAVYGASVILLVVVTFLANFGLNGVMVVLAVVIGALALWWLILVLKTKK